MHPYVSQTQETASVFFWGKDFSLGSWRCSPGGPFRLWHLQLIVDVWPILNPKSTYILKPKLTFFLLLNYSNKPYKFSIRSIHYCSYSESTEQKTGKSHLCAMYRNSNFVASFKLHNISNFYMHQPELWHHC